MKQILIVFALLTAFSLSANSQTPQKRTKMEKKNYYCEYCGRKFPDVRQLTSGTCSRHPDGGNKGHHKLYEGSEKAKYTCKYCGRQFQSLQIMVTATCSRHPKGSSKGGHAPAL